jgi:UDP-3-O-[3-hydroxymyristoyl] glucosamine N-acyltransferase
MPTVSDILRFLEQRESIRLPGFQADTSIEQAMSLGEAGQNAVSFCGSTARDPQSLLASTHATLLIVDQTFPIDVNLLAKAGVQAVVRSPNARLDFVRVVERFFAKPMPRGIHATAVIDPEANIHPEVYIGPFTYVGKCEIGEGTVIYGHVHVYSKTRIGRNVIIHAGTVIGADGFGYQRNETGELEKFPHIGGVIIEDNVEIGSNTIIDRGTLGDTIIREGAKIDNLVHIAHNVVVGRHAAVIAHAMVGGSTRIGDYAWVAPSACLRDGISIGDRATVGLGALVVKDVPDDTTVMGAPARPIEEQKRLLRRLADLATDEGRE